MSDEARDKTGPLTEMQHEILRGLADGQDHARIGERIGKSRAHVARVLNNSIYPKLGVRKSTEAAAVYSRYLTYLQVADWLLNAKVPEPLGETEEHVNHVLEDLAEEYRKLAGRLMPS